MRLLARAARLNQHQAIVRRAIGVALGISEAFAKEPKLLPAWLEDLKGEAAPAGEANKPRMNAAMAWFAQQPKVSSQQSAVSSQKPQTENRKPKTGF